MKCDICGKEDIKNLGVHKYKAHQIIVSEKGFKEEIEREKKLYVDDVFKEKPLSVLVSEIKDLLKPYQNELVIRIAEKGGKMKEIEITARIQL